MDAFVSAINRGDVKDTEVEAIMDSVVNSLFSLFVTLGEHLIYQATAAVEICLADLAIDHNVLSGRCVI